MASGLGVRGRALLWVPLGLFGVLALVIAIGLWRPADRTVRSALVGKPLPVFAVPPLLAGRAGVRTGDYVRGRPRLLNVFASWCVPCAAEAPQLMRLHAMGVPVDGVAIRDEPGAVAGFLHRYGDPYDHLGDDKASRVQLAIGSSGVPETFVIGGDGRILAQHVGDIRADEVDALAAQAR